MKLVVRSVLHESSIEAVPNTRLRELFNLISKSLGIQETWWFGLLYYNEQHEEIWLEQSKKVSTDIYYVHILKIFNVIIFLHRNAVFLDTFYHSMVNQ